MRARLAAVLSLLLICFAFQATAVHAKTITLAQDTESEGGEVTSESEGEGGADAETGASEEESSGEAATEEEGPPWTYQMARIGLALMVIVGLLMGLLYYRMIASRQSSA